MILYRDISLCLPYVDKDYSINKKENSEIPPRSILFSCWSCQAEYFPSKSPPTDKYPWIVALLLFPSNSSGNVIITSTVFLRFSFRHCMLNSYLKYCIDLCMCKILNKLIELNWITDFDRVAQLIASWSRRLLWYVRGFGSRFGLRLSGDPLWFCHDATGEFLLGLRRQVWEADTTGTCARGLQ